MGNKSGAETRRQRYGDDWQAKIGAMGGKKSGSRPFRDRPGLAKEANKKSQESRKKPLDTSVE